MLLDPTFDLTVRATNGEWATASDVSQATRAMRFSDVTYQFLGERGDAVAKSYYLDYPLLYLEVCDEDGCSDPFPSSLPYMDPVSMPVNTSGFYAIQGVPGGTVDALVEGTAAHFDCDQDGLTYIFGAASIEALPGFSIKVFRPHRFVF